jgi:serine phosphatase RsbU (regulator of sigma subunit)
MSRLIVESGNEEGMVFPLGEGAITIGRSASATIQIVDKRISRHHIALRLNRDTYQVEDLGSKNGTLMNGEPLVGVVKLKSGDRLQMGDTVLVFEREPGEPASGLSDSTKSSPVRLVADELGRQHQAFRVESSPIISSGERVSREVLREPFERLRVLYQISDSIRGELKLDDLLEKIMDISWSVVSPYRGVILLRDEKDGTLDPVVVRSRDDEGEITISSTIVERCIAERVAILVSDAPSDLRFSANESIIAGKIRSAICAPIVWKNEVLGVIYIDSQESGKVYYTDDEVELVSGIANQAAMAITNARLHREALDRQRLEKELEIARTIQMNLLPRSYPEVDGLCISAMSMPARKVGGDYYDFVPLEDGRVAIIIADVSGKGVPAAILTATIRASIRVESHQPGLPPVKNIVSAINRWTCRDATNNMFVTMVYAIYDPRKKTLEYTNAGHCFPLLFRPNKEYISLETGGCFLGMMEEAEYQTATVQLQPGDTLVMYTDGVTDAHNENGELLGIEKAISAIKANLHLPPEELRDAIYDTTLDFRGESEQFDDLTIIVVRL